MRTSPALAMLLAACTADGGAELDELAISNSYLTTYTSFGFPEGTYYNKDIHLTINRDPGVGATYFFSHQFGIEGSGGYIGLQTDGARPDGSVGKLAIFSIWDASGAAAGSGGSWCQAFGGEGVGQSCRIPYDWVEGGTYRLRVWAFSRNSWGGWIMDAASGAEVFLGTIDTPGGMGWLQGSSTPFGEYYGPDFGSCNDLRNATVTWHNPTADGGAVGSWVASNSIGGGACPEVRSSQGAGPTVHSMGGRAAPGCGALHDGQQLYRGEALWSCDGRFALAMQHDGNLVLYQAGVAALWATGTDGSPAVVAVMQGDGNLVLYDVDGTARWHASTHGNPGAWLAMQDDGNLVVYSAGNQALWASGTCCR